MLRTINRAESTRRVFCYIRGAYHVELFRNICKLNPDIEFYFHSDNVSEEGYRNSALYELGNVIFVRDLREILPKAGAFGAFLTTDAQAAYAHRYALKLVNLFHHLHIPVLEVQHGLFQLGLHYYDVPEKELFQPDSLPTSSYADYILTYYQLPDRPNCMTIGYPPYEHAEPPCPGQYTLILSNLHWGTYSDEEKYAFYRAIYEYVEEHSDQLFIWRMHMAEINHAVYQKFSPGLRCLFPKAARCLQFAHENAMMKKMPAAELIRKSARVISSISTVLLDCERFCKPTFVYKAPSTACLWEQLESAPCFSNAAELAAAVQEGRTFRTGCLQRYDNEAFRACLERVYRLSDLPQSELLSDIILTL